MSINLVTTNPQRIDLALKVQSWNGISPMHCLTSLKILAELRCHEGTLGATCVFLLFWECQLWFRSSPVIRSRKSSLTLLRLLPSTDSPKVLLSSISWSNTWNREAHHQPPWIWRHRSQSPCRSCCTDSVAGRLRIPVLNRKHLGPFSLLSLNNYHVSIDFCV